MLCCTVLYGMVSWSEGISSLDSGLFFTSWNHGPCCQLLSWVASGQLVIIFSHWRDQISYCSFLWDDLVWFVLVLDGLFQTDSSGNGTGNHTDAEGLDSGSEILGRVTATSSSNHRWRHGDSVALLHLVSTGRVVSIKIFHLNLSFLCHCMLHAACCLSVRLSAQHSMHTPQERV